MRDDDDDGGKGAAEDERTGVDVDCGGLDMATKEILVWCKFAYGSTFDQMPFVASLAEMEYRLRGAL